MTAAVVRLWDGDLNLIGSIDSGYVTKAECTLTLPLTHEFAERLLMSDTMVRVTVDRDDNRWCGCLDILEVVKVNGERVLRLHFIPPRFEAMATALRGLPA